MSRAKTAFTAAQVERALRGARKAGLPIARVEITASGSIVILPNLEPEPPTADGWFERRTRRAEDPDDRD